MLLWIIPAVLLLLIGLTLSAKVGVRVVFGKELTAFLKIGPVTKQVYPLPEKAKGSGQKKEKRKKQKEKRQFTWEAVRELLADLRLPVLDALNCGRKGLHVRVLRLHLTVSDRNPAAAAQRYGKLNAFLWPLLAAVENLVCVERRDVTLALDFSAGASSAEGELFVTIRLYHGLLIFISDGPAILKALLRFFKRTAPEKESLSKQAKQTAAEAA